MLLFFRTLSYHKTSYYVPESSALSRNVFGESLNTSLINTPIVKNNHVLINSTEEPIFINGHFYYFGNDNYKSTPGRIQCTVRIEDFKKNTVPLNTRFPSADSIALLDANLSFTNDSQPYQVDSFFLNIEIF